MPEAAPNPSASAAQAPGEGGMTTLHERAIAAMSYMGFFAIVPFYLNKDSQFCRFHGKQGMVVALIFFLARLLTAIDLIFDLVLILQVIIFFSMGLSALSGKWKRLPFIYGWACQLEATLTLKDKSEEDELPRLRPDELPQQKTESSSTSPQQSTPSQNV